MSEEKTIWRKAFAMMPEMVLLVFWTLVSFGFGFIVKRGSIVSTIDPKPKYTIKSFPVIDGGSFEGEFIEFSQRVWVEDGWAPVSWYGEPMIGGGNSGSSSQPEYKPLTADIDPYRVRSGEQSQCWFWFYTHGDSAIWRKVSVPAGKIQGVAYAHAWVSDKDDAPHSSPGEMYVSIGIDPDGRDPGTSWPWETSVIWSPFKLIHEDWDQVLSHPVYVEEPGEITIYLRAWKKWNDKHGDVYWDDWSIHLIDDSAVIQPTHTPLATYTPAATYTPLPTFTPLPTYTPQPTPVPGCTPVPVVFKCEYLVDELTGTSLLRCGDEYSYLYQDASTGEWACPR